MKLRVNKEQAKRLLKEDLNQANNKPGESANVISALTDPNAVKDAENNLSKWGDIKKKMDNIMMKEEEPQDPVRLELKDHIDDLLLKLYDFTFFNDKSESANEPKHTNQASLFPDKGNPAKVIGFFQKLDDNTKQALIKQYPVLKMLVDGQLEDAFKYLIRRSQQFNENNLVNSRIFGIIAESENPRLTKNDLLTFLKEKNEKLTRN